MSHCHCHENHCHEHEEGRGMLLRLCLSGALFLAALFLPLTGAARVAAFLLPYLLIGWDVLWGAIKNILHGEFFDEAFLMSLATVGAIAIGEYPEAVAVMLFYQLGEWLQGLAVGKSRRSIAALLELQPDTVVVLRDGKECGIPVEEAMIGDIFVVKAGERIALDGTVVHGISAVNNAALTGESLPQTRTVGDRVLSGGINVDGLLQIRCESLYHDSTVAKILELVEHATEKKARVEGFITRFSRIYTPLVVLAALLLAIVPPLVLSQSFAPWLHRALVFLVVSCPCALVVSVPLSFFGGLGAASRKGILIKGASYLEQLTKLNTVVFDKTGTLTEGSFTLAEIHVVRGTEAELLRLAATAERGSKHPIAESIVSAYGKPTQAPEELQELAGLGLRAVIGGEEYFFGNRLLMQQAQAEPTFSDLHGTPVHVAKRGRYLGCLVIRDTLRPEAKEALSSLNTKTVMLTGDAKPIAQAVAKELKMDAAYAELLPQDKLTRLEELLCEGVTAFVGDGINDAPVLARADLGIAMGGIGSDAAIASADIVLMDDDLRKLPAAQRLAKKTMRIVRQNITLALGAKAVILLLGAFGIANMWIAVFGDVGIMLLATLNALRTLQT